MQVPKLSTQSKKERLAQANSGEIGSKGDECCSVSWRSQTASLIWKSFYNVDYIY
ncbi:MAG: hypothetical protein Ta2E_12870 [Mycoplasmoidaceae bacterium]|nr:MAG: hypothetical protein Ta2E_12870 [Mycoplasmoidaceae bacterium]